SRLSNILRGCSAGSLVPAPQNIARSSLLTLLPPAIYDGPTRTHGGSQLHLDVACSLDRVTILERDVISGNLETRPRMLQTRHLHALLPRGRRMLEHCFRESLPNSRPLAPRFSIWQTTSHGSRRKAGACDSPRNLKR